MTKGNVDGVSVEQHSEDNCDYNQYTITTPDNQAIILTIGKTAPKYTKGRNYIQVDVRRDDNSLVQHIRPVIQEAAAKTPVHQLRDEPYEETPNLHSFFLKLPANLLDSRENCEVCLQTILSGLAERNLLSESQTSYIWECEETSSYFSKNYPETPQTRGHSK